MNKTCGCVQLSQSTEVDTGCLTIDLALMHRGAHACPSILYLGPFVISQININYCFLKLITVNNLDNNMLQLLIVT